MKFLRLCFILFLFFNTTISFAKEPATQNQAFREAVMMFVRESAFSDFSLPAFKEKALDKTWYDASANMGPHLTHWAVKISVYSKGQMLGQGTGCNKKLSHALITATKAAIKNTPPNTFLQNAQFVITFYYPPENKTYTFVNDHKHVFELIEPVIPIRYMNSTLLNKRIDQETNYLLSVIDAKTYATPKVYLAKKDKIYPKLRTLYTASTLYTLLSVQEKFPSPKIAQMIEPMANFLLNMQENSGPNKGAFHYSFDPTTQQKDKRFGQGRFVVGTASKTIFTLLKLYQYNKNPMYLNAAIEAGNWLVTRVDSNGLVHPVSMNIHGKYITTTKQSFLYSGQVLSALSRLYLKTHLEIYKKTAYKIAQNMIHYVHDKGAIVGDDYRKPNSISTSWVVMSLLDYAKIDTYPLYREVIQKLAKALVKRQIKAPWDTYNDGRLIDILTASGNGWVNEVMTNLYPFCAQEHLGHCRLYRDYTIHSSRWLMQNIFLKANSFKLPNPNRAQGGLIRNFSAQSIRTDSVCHGLNSLIGLSNIVGPEPQIFIIFPETPFEQLRPLLQVGSLPIL